MKKDTKQFFAVVGLFYIFNIINTYFVTTAVLNRYFIAFKRTPFLEINSIIGNFAVLTIFLLIGFLIFKSIKSRMTFLIVLTTILNIAIFSIGIFTKFYQTMFSIYEITLFFNPALELGGSIIVEALKEVFVYYRIVVFLPTFVMIGSYYFLSKSYNGNKDKFKQKSKLHYGPLVPILALILGLFVSFTTLGIAKTSMERRWPINAERSSYGVQSAGLYNYYFGELLGVKIIDRDYEEPDLSKFDQYNRNTESYINFLEESYGNILNINQASTVNINSSLLIDNNLNGVFKDKNIVVIHVETFNHFLIQEDNQYFDESYYKTLKALMNESYVLDNFYTNVGIGNSADAEFTAMTGLYPRGDTTIFWNYNETPYEFDALPKLFDNYQKTSLHGDVAVFYNRAKVHENMFGFDSYIYYDEREENYEGTKNGFHKFSDMISKTDVKSPWLSDLSLLEWTKKEANRIKLNGDNYMLFPVMIQPHTPYLYDPFMDNPQFTKNDINVDATTMRLLNYEKSADLFYEKFIEMTKELDNTVYVFYADHGTGITKRDLETILGRELSYMEYKTEMLKTNAFVYAPDDNDKTSVVPRGLLRGKQPLLRSQVDIYRTIVELFSLETNQYYYGVNALSDEHTFSIDTRTFDILTDDYFLLSKHLATDESRTPENVLYYKNKDDVLVDPFEMYNRIIVFKKRMDEMITYNLQQYLLN